MLILQFYKQEFYNAFKSKADKELHVQHPIRTTLQLGQLLLSARKQQGLSQAELAARLGLSQARISQLEQQPETITALQLLQLTSVLGLELLVQSRDSTQDAGSTEAEW